MISNLEAYSEWKKSTLKRITERYRRELMGIVGSRMEPLRKSLEESIATGRMPTWTDGRKLKNSFLPIFERHQWMTTLTAVADGVKETSKLSSWEESYQLPVEQVLNAAELKLKDTYATKIARAIRKKNAKRIDAFAGEVSKSYLAFVRETFRHVVKDYMDNEDTDDTQEAVTNALKYIYKRTDAQAQMMFRTETTRYFNEARVQFFKSGTDVDFVQLVAITDGRISDICECRDGYVIPISKATLRKFQPPFHPNCRTVQSPLDTDLRGDLSEVRRNLGSEFGEIKSKTSGKVFNGRRAPPNVKLPRGWL